MKGPELGAAIGHLRGNVFNAAAEPMLSVRADMSFILWISDGWKENTWRGIFASSKTIPRNDLGKIIWNFVHCKLKREEIERERQKFRIVNGHLAESIDTLITRAELLRPNSCTVWVFSNSFGVQNQFF